MKKKFTLNCQCGCGTGLNFDFSDIIYASFSEGMFYSNQHTFLKQWRQDFRRAKSGCFADLMTDRNNLINLKKFLEGLTCTNEEISNIGALEFEYEKEYGTYAIYLMYKPSISQIISRKLYRVYEFELNEALRKKLVEGLDKLLSSKENYTFTIK